MRVDNAGSASHHKPRHTRALASCALAILWFGLLCFGTLAAGGSPTAQAHGAVNAAPSDTATPGGPPFPTSTPKETATATSDVTKTVAPTRAPSQSNFTPGPQPTRVNFSQPTIGASGNFNSPGIAGAPGGPNGLVIATITGCVTGLLALIITVISFIVLRRDGYAPFLRTLLLGSRGKKDGQSRRKTSRGRGNARRALGGADEEVNRGYARSSGRSRGGAW
jgi:hypothetical protein